MLFLMLFLPLAATYRPEWVLRRSLEIAAQRVGLEYLNIDEFRVEGTLHSMDIVELNEAASHFRANLTITYEYLHPGLQWNASDFSGLNATVMSAATLLAPRIDGCYKTMSLKDIGNVPIGNARVTNDGKVLILANLTTQTHCRMKINASNHKCAVYLYIKAVDKFKMYFDEEYTFTTPTGWLFSGRIASRSELKIGEFSNITQVGIEFVISRDHWMQWSGTEKALFLLVITACLYVWKHCGTKALSIPAGFSFALALHYAVNEPYLTQRKLLCLLVTAQISTEVVRRWMKRKIRIGIEKND